MNNYIAFNETGRVLFSFRTNSIPEIPGATIAQVAENVLDVGSVFFENGELKQKGLSPSIHHTWDWTTKSWLPNLDAARESKLRQVAAELNARLYLPCDGFDADAVSRERISGTIARLQRGGGLPAGWIGWRDASNQQRWAEDDAATVLASLVALSCAIEDREQALLTASWQHKANLNALEDFNEILSYDTTAGWPT